VCLQKEGRQQIKAGVSLIQWSKLARWNGQKERFVALPEDEFESWAKEVHKDYGRLICWIAFSVGSEYFVKGVCLVLQKDLKVSTKQVFRAPPRKNLPEDMASEKLQEWIDGVLNDDIKFKENAQIFGTLGNEVDKCLKDIRPQSALVRASFKFLASAVRNRDAHRYTRNVRAFHFHAVERVLVPSFNVLLEMVNKT
jgi:hypothetical protein